MMISNFSSPVSTLPVSAKASRTICGSCARTVPKVSELTTYLRTVPSIRGSLLRRNKGSRRLGAEGQGASQAF